MEKLITHLLETADLITIDGGAYLDTASVYINEDAVYFSETIEDGEIEYVIDYDDMENATKIKDGTYQLDIEKVDDCKEKCIIRFYSLKVHDV